MNNLDNKKIKNINLNISSGRIDLFLWILIAFVICVGILVNYFYYSEYLFVKFFFFLLFFILVFFLLFKTNYGKQLKVYFQYSIIEFYKIVWPTRKEIFSSLLSILIMIFIVSFLLWIMDTVILLIIGYIIKYNVGV